jgi:hypothetical protein
MTGTICVLTSHSLSRSYLNHLVLLHSALEYTEQGRHQAVLNFRVIFVIISPTHAQFTSLLRTCVHVLAKLLQS